jgi:hypothetical protein
MPGKTASTSAYSSKLKPSTPHAVHHLIVSLNKVEKAIKAAVRAYQRKVRKEAQKSWGDVAKTINVTFDYKTMLVNIYSNHPDADMLEHGSLESPPKPVIRMAAIEAQKDLIPLIKEQFIKIGLK